MSETKATYHTESKGAQKGEQLSDHAEALTADQMFELLKKGHIQTQKQITDVTNRLDRVEAKLDKLIEIVSEKL